MFLSGASVIRPVSKAEIQRAVNKKLGSVLSILFGFMLERQLFIVFTFLAFKMQYEQRVDKSKNLVLTMFDMALTCVIFAVYICLKFEFMCSPGIVIHSVLITDYD